MARNKCSEKQRKGLENSIIDCLGFEIAVTEAWREDGRLFVTLVYESRENKNVEKSTGN